MYRKVYLLISSLILALTTMAGVAITIAPIQQHGRGMGAALAAAYIMLAWGLAVVNFAVALVIWFRRPDAWATTERNEGKID